MKSLLREPLIGFLALGAVIFWLDGVRSGPEVITVDPAVIDRLVEERELVLERQLAPGERDAIRQNFIDQEILLREALDMGLHLSDGRVRHRLADKMMFLLVDEPPPPDADTLQAFYLEHRERYTTDRLVSFEHRFFSDDRASAQRVLATGVGDPDPQEAFFWLGNALQRMSAQDLATTFGPGFSRALEDLPTGEWRGPIASSRGWHIVRVTAWHPSEPIPRDQLDERLRTEWLAQQRDDARATALAGLREQYEVLYRSGDGQGGR